MQPLSVHVDRSKGINEPLVCLISAPALRELPQTATLYLDSHHSRPMMVLTFLRELATN